MAITTQQREALKRRVKEYRRAHVEMDDYVVALLVSGATYQEIATVMGWSRQRVHQQYSMRVVNNP
jgi:hypothetical protein